MEQQEEVIVTVLECCVLRVSALCNIFCKGSKAVLEMYRMYLGSTAIPSFDSLLVKFSSYYPELVSKDFLSSQDL